MLIGDIVPPDVLMNTLTDRKTAEQERITYETQKKNAQTARQSLEQATALANTQSTVVDPERQVSISEFRARDEVASAEGSAKAKKINAKADAAVLLMTGDAEAAKTKVVGQAEAEVITLKVNSLQPENYTRIQITDALAKAKIRLVPEILAGGSSGVSGGTPVAVLIGGLVQEQLRNRTKDPEHTSASGQAAPEAHTEVSP